MRGVDTTKLENEQAKTTQGLASPLLPSKRWTAQYRLATKEHILD